MNVRFYFTPSRQRIDVKVTLSRRNPRALLVKLAYPSSKATLAREVEAGMRLEVRAESDEVHYAEREPGQMTLWTEAALQAGFDGEDAS